MNGTTPPTPKPVYSESDFDSLNFHDCSILGMRWRDSAFEFVLDLQYIAKWIEPSDPTKNYRFWLCPAEMSFKNVDSADITLRWEGLPLRCSIDELGRLSKRQTPNGTVEWQWELQLAEPDGQISLWATSFELKILGPAVLSDVPRLNR